MGDAAGELNEYLKGWIGFFWIVTGETAERTLRNLDARIRRRLRAVLLKHWRSKRSIARRLIARVSTEEGLADGLRGATTPLGPEPNCGGAEESPKRILQEKRGLFSLTAWHGQRWARARPGTAQSGAGTGIAAGAQALAPA
ncbi:MAG: hypothetical protein IPN83_04135 [Holophagales bacterium]|nr:hypothetical protein [Holophagales bacterium]